MQDLETGNSARILGGLTLSVVEVSGEGNNDVGCGVAEVSFSGLLRFAESHSRDFLKSLRRGDVTEAENKV